MAKNPYEPGSLAHFYEEYHKGRLKHVRDIKATQKPLDQRREEQTAVRQSPVKLRIYLSLPKVAHTYHREDPDNGPANFRALLRTMIRYLSNERVTDCPDEIYDRLSNVLATLPVADSYDGLSTNPPELLSFSLAMPLTDAEHFQKAIPQSIFAPYVDTTSWSFLKYEKEAP
jgi:hypothetical protein